MERIIFNKITPLMKCMVLFLFIFTAKVLTSRPEESQEIKNGIHHVKPSHYVRTFTKYHHRRTIHWNNNNNDQDINNYWPPVSEQQKIITKRSLKSYNFHENTETKDKIIDLEVDNEPITYRLEKTNKIEKRSANFLNSNEFGDTSHSITRLDQLTSSNGKDVTFETKALILDNSKNSLPDNVKAYKVKAAVIPTPATTTMGPTISCLYKIHDSLSLSVTPSYADDKNTQLVVEIDNFGTGPISESTLPNGDTMQVEQCTDSRASCYTLWHQDNMGNITVLGQGCWRSSTESRKSCDKCTRAVKLPGTKFCCCTKHYCNADFLSLKEEVVTMKAESTMDTTSRTDNGSTSNIAASAILAVIAILVVALVLRKIYCKKLPIVKDDTSDAADVEKGDVMGTGPDALATGLACVDNLTLIEHIGQGKYGSVWRGSLGSTPVAVKLYSSSHAWQKEASMYALPHLAHPNLLRYYGSDNRQSGSQLVVLELCGGPLRARLQHAPLSWREFAHLAHGLASALAHLHTPSAHKPCVVHRDVNSNNVLVTSRGAARLADLGLAQALHAPRERVAPARIAEAGTLRYLAPEALEGALDLSGALAALCAVDVFALGLVLWEMLWRTRGAHSGAVPPYAPPYHHAGLPQNPTLAQMQNLVSRNKARPPLPKGPVQHSRALKIASDTCDECWDHDAEARLTAVCVEERMAELEQRLLAKGPLVLDLDNIHPHTYPPAESTTSSPADMDKNSNCTSTQICDVHTPLLYPQPHMGRNACIERNTHNNTQQTTVELIHKSLKDITAPVETQRAPSNEEHCLSVARISHNRRILAENSGLNEIRSYQRPLEYVQNDVTSHEDRGPKQTNLLHNTKTEKPKWGIKRFFQKLNRNKLETEVTLDDNSQRTLTSLVDKPSNSDRPTNLDINQDRAPFNFEGPCTLSPPNKTLSPTMMMGSDKVFNFKELPARDDARTPNQIFAVIVPKSKPTDLHEMTKKRGSSDSLNKRSINTPSSSHSIIKSNSESEDSTVKKRLSCDQQVIDSGSSSKASINLELQYIDNPEIYNGNVSPFDINSDCSSSDDEHLMLLSENGGSKITMQTITKPEQEKRKYQNDVLKESSQVTDFTFNKIQNKYTNFDNEFSDPNDKENLVNGYSGDNPVYLAALNGEIDTAELKYNLNDVKSPKPALKNLAIRRQHSLEQVSEIFSSSGDVNLLNPAGRVKTPGDLPVAIRRARRDRALQKGRASECNRLSLYDDRMMFGNSL